MNRWSLGGLSWIALLCAGCASSGGPSTVRPSPEPVPTRTITLVLRPLPSFEMVTPGKSAAGSLFGVVGFVASEASMTKAGNELVRRNNVDDPAVGLGKVMLSEVAEHYGFQVRDAGGVLSKAEAFNDIAKSYPGSDVILDVKTWKWAAMYVPDFSHYGIEYIAYANLIDVKSGKLIASATCTHHAARTKNPPTYDDLLANEAENLKTRSAEAAEYCHVKLRERMFGKSG